MTTSIKTASGLYFDLADPRPHMVNFQDIAHGLKAMPRWTGHTHLPWSVADHSVLTWQLLLDAEPDASVERQLHVLMHDAHEAYIGDASTPLKRVVPELRALGEKIQRVILKALQLPWPDDETIAAMKLADARALEIEWYSFMGCTDPIDPSTAEGITNWDLDWRLRYDFPRVFHRLMRERDA